MASDKDLRKLADKIASMIEIEFPDMFERIASIEEMLSKISVGFGAVPPEKPENPRYKDSEKGPDIAGPGVLSPDPDMPPYAGDIEPSSTSDEEKADD